MYHYLTGRLAEKSTAYVVLDVGGVGYQISVPLSTHEALPNLGETVKLLTYFVVREDQQALYGFLTEAERNLFKLLISVSGIGPKTALIALSGVPIGELRRAIVDGSLHVLTGISGIGRKTAERIVVELREKLVLDERKVEIAGMNLSQGEEDLVQDSLQALLQLGYRRQSAREAIQKALKAPHTGKLSVEGLVRESLKHV